MAVCLVPCCDRRSISGGMCGGHYKRRQTGNFDDTPIGDHLPPIPPGLTEACTARLTAISDGAQAEQIASIRLRLLIRDILEP